MKNKIGRKPFFIACYLSAIRLIGCKRCDILTIHNIIITMRNTLTILFLTLMLFAGIAKADQQVSHNMLQTINEQRATAGQYSTEKRRADGHWLLAEAAMSCKQTKFVRSLFLGMLFDGEYECAGLGNTFNSKASVPLNAGFGQITDIVGTIALLVLFVLTGLRILKAVTGHKDSEMKGRASAPAFVMLLAILAFFGTPVITDDDGENPINYATALYWALWLHEADAAGQYLTSDTAAAVLKSPVISILRNTMQKNDLVSNTLRFKLCDADNVVADKKYAEGEIAFNYTEGFITSFTQKGKCILKSTIQVNTETVKIASVLNLVDYKAFFIEQYKQAWTYLNNDVTDLAEIIINQVGKAPPRVYSSFDKTDFSCKEWKNYNVNGLSSSGLAEYADKAGECISQEMTRIMNKYPNVDEGFFGTKIKGRGVHLCGQDTTATVGQGSAIDGKNDDWTGKLKAANGTMQSLNDKLTSCVSESCTPNSSIRVCSAAINLYANLISDTDIISPSLMAMPNNFIAIEMPSKKFDEDGKLPFASFEVTAGTDDSLLDDDFMSEVVFKIPYKNSVRENSFARAEDVLDTFYMLDINVKDALQAPVKVITFGEDGPMGFKRTEDCLDYPYQISPSGRACNGPFKEMLDQGARLTATGLKLKAGAFLAGTKRSRVERDMEAAAIGATKTALNKMDLLDSGFLISKLITVAGIDAATNDDESGDIDASASMAFAFAYNIPALKSVINSIGNTAIATGLFLSFAQQLNIFLTSLSLFMNTIYAYVFYALTFTLYFVLLLSRNNGVNPTTDWFEPFDRMVKTYMTLVIYPIVFKHSVIYIKSIFFFQVINTKAMMNNTGGIEPYVNTLAQLPQALWVGIISVAIPLFMIGGFLSYTRKSPQLVSAIGFGNTKEGMEENLGFPLKKLDL